MRHMQLLQGCQSCSAHPSRTMTSHRASDGSRPLRDKKQQLHWWMCEPSNSPTKSHKSQVGLGNLQRNNGRKAACTALQNSRRTSGENPGAPARPLTEGRVWSQHKHAPQNGRETTRKDVRGSVSSCSLTLCGRSTKTFPHSWMTCLQN